MGKEEEVLLEDLENSELIKDKATLAIKKRQSNPKTLSNVINFEKNVINGKSYLDVASSKGNKKDDRVSSLKKESEDKEYENLKKEFDQLKKKYKKLVNDLIDR